MLDKIVLVLLISLIHSETQTLKVTPLETNKEIQIDPTKNGLICVQLYEDLKKDDSFYLVFSSEEKGIKIVHVTLHVGLGTFRPVMVDDIKSHKMHSEHFILTKEAADTLNSIRQSGGKIYAVGTTSVRTLETVMQKNDKFVPMVGDTEIFIYPGFNFKAIDGLITNFHLPKSTLVMLVSALAGRENILNAYKIAVNEKYRFFSFGDAMLIK